MAEAPKTGDTSLVWVLAAAASGAGSGLAGGLWHEAQGPRRLMIA